MGQAKAAEILLFERKVSDEYSLLMEAGDENCGMRKVKKLTDYVDLAEVDQIRHGKGVQV